MIDLYKQDDVFVMHLRSGENRLNLDFVEELHRTLDKVEASTEATALVSTGEGKYYSNGLDLEWMATDAGRALARTCIKRVHQLLGRLLTFPMITVSAINGHSFAAGAMLSLAHDFRVMRSDRGYFCLPEVDIQIPFTPPMAALIQARLSKSTAHEAMVTGKRYTADEALRAGIAQAVAPEAEVLATAVALAKPHVAKSRATVAAIKQGMYAEVLAAIAAEGAEDAAL